MGSNFNEGYFENIDTKDKAYWLGFFYADGCVFAERNRISLCLSIKDEEQIRKFCDAVSIDKKEIKIRKHSIKSIGKTYYSANIVKGSKKMFNDLFSHGCIPHKTMRLKLPVLDSDGLYKAFLLGYYDGDGISGSSAICSGCLSFLMEIKKKFNIVFDPKLKINPFGQCYVLSLGWELKNEIMNNFKNSMKRKRKISNGIFRFKKGMKYSHNGKPCFRQSRPVNIDISKEELQKMIIEKPIIDVSKELKISYKGMIKHLRENNFIIPSSKQKNIAKRKFNIDKEKLEKLITTMPMTTIGKMFGVSDNAIRKRARLYGILKRCSGGEIGETHGA